MEFSRAPSILVVDDESDLCQNLADILQEFGYEVETALGGEAALEIVRSRSFDVALLDLKMPGIDGITLCERIHRIRPDIVALIVTAYASPQADLASHRAGVWQVLSKPVDLPLLISLVGDATRRPVLMIVDDDIDLCRSLSEILREQGYRIRFCHTDLEALRGLEEQHFHVILVDLKLASGDGRTVLKKFQDRASATKSILITGYPAELEIPIEWTVQPDAVCFKPFDLPLLLSTIARLSSHSG